MLAQNFKTAADLGISERQKDALAKTLVLLETGKLEFVDPDSLKVTNRFIPHEERKFSGHFNMESWSVTHSCGTACCIGGTAELIGGLKGDECFDYNVGGLDRLFFPRDIGMRRYADITTEQAAIALRSYLTTGEPRWKLAVNQCPQETARD